MELYRITLSKYANALYAPAYPGRWNSKGIPVIYCSWSRSLASLENLVHRGDKVLSSIFSIMVIEVEDSVKLASISVDSLLDDWAMTSVDAYRTCQRLGDDWVKSSESCLLEIPSAIIHEESNYMINPAHEDFDKVKLKRVEKFCFDKRMFSRSL